MCIVPGYQQQIETQIGVSTARACCEKRWGGGLVSVLMQYSTKAKAN